MLLLNDLSKVAPVRKIYFRGKRSKFARKELNKTKTKTQNKNFFKAKATQAKLAYNKQINICLTILRKSKKVYFENLDETS